MPICPNCGSYVSEGDHTCSCGTSFSYNSYEEREEEEDPEEVERKERGRQCYLEACSLERQGRYGEALWMYERSRDLGHSGFSSYDRARIYSEMGDYQKALEIYEGMHCSNGNYKLTRLIGRTLYRLKRYDEALEKFFNALGIIKESSEFIQDYTNPNYGIYYTQEELDRAAMKKEKRKRAELAKTYNDIAWVYKDQKNYNVAIKYIDEAILFDKSEPNHPNVKAIILEDMGSFRQSKEYYDRAIEMDPDTVFIENRARMIRDWCRNSDDMDPKKAEKLITEAIDSLSGIDTDEDINEYIMIRNSIRDGRKLESQDKLLGDIDSRNLITITGTRFYGCPVFTEGMVLKLVREPDNAYDGDAIAVYHGDEKVGYVANSIDTACYLTTTASNLDIGDCASAEYVFNYASKYHIARIVR